MPFTIAPTQFDLTKALGRFIKAVLPGDIFVTVASPNRVAEPKVLEFVVLNPLRFVRLSTSFDAYQDVRFTAASTDGRMEVTDVNYGEIIIGSNLFAVGLPIPTTILSQTSGDPGGVGVYELDSDTTLDQRVFAAGGFTITQNSQATVQIDIHSNTMSAADYAQIVSTAFRDTYGVEFFAALEAPLDKIAPLFADDPRLRPGFINDQDQFEWVYMIDAQLQVNQTIRAPLQYAEILSVGIVNVQVVSVDDLQLDYSKSENSQYFPGL